MSEKSEYKFKWDAKEIKHRYVTYFLCFSLLINETINLQEMIDKELISVILVKRGMKLNLTADIFFYAIFKLFY